MISKIIYDIQNNCTIPELKLILQETKKQLESELKKKEEIYFDEYTET